MEECLVVAWDGYGPDQSGYPWCTGVYIGNKGNLQLVEQVNIWNSVGLYYGAVTLALGFKLNDGEGKTMGFASYGKNSKAVIKMREFFPSFKNEKWQTKSNWMEICGVSRLEFFKMTRSYKQLISMINEYGSEQVAYAAQEIFEEVCEGYIKYLVKKYGISDLAVAGGLFLNVKFNMKLLKNKTVKKLFIYPNPGDGGVAVGAAIAAYKELGYKRPVELMESASLGCEYKSADIEKSYLAFKKLLTMEKLGKNTAEVTARKISEGKVIGWFEGKSEWGPRALGNRSVLADPRHEETKERINKHLKKRDWFMPFAPAIMEEYMDEYLQNGFGTPFMTLADDVKKQKKSKIAAAIHVDGTARFQLVNKKTSLKYWSVIDEFRKITGVPVILNTSFNKHGLPIVHTPTDALEHLVWGCLDELIIGEYLFARRNDES
jgi:carbamoyltransferase